MPLSTIVDGCFGGPIQCLELLCLIEAERGDGRGTAIIETIGCRCRKHGRPALALDAELTGV